MKVFQVLFLIFAFSVFANAQKSILTGSVYDANGAVIVKAKVAAIDQKGERFEAETNDEGIYILNLPFYSYDTKKSADFRIAKYEIVVDVTNRGFEKFILIDFKFVPSYTGKMNLDIALDTLNPEPCGYGGAGCLNQGLIKNEITNTSDKILQKPLGKLPKAQNKKKRKNKINKQ